MLKLSDGVKLFILIYVLIMAPIALALFVDFHDIEIVTCEENIQK